jgi:hypothetical protein
MVAIEERISLNKKPRVGAYFYEVYSQALGFEVKNENLHGF